MAFVSAISASQVAATAAGISAATSVAAARQASAAGKYNQAIQERIETTYGYNYTTTTINVRE